MKYHARTLIRHAFIALLKGKTLAKDRVFDSRLYPMEHSSLPGIIIFSNNEEISTTTITHPRLQERTLRMIVECYFKAANEVNMECDCLAAQVEKTILAPSALKAVCRFDYKDCKLESIDTTLNSDGDMPIVVTSLVFAVIYAVKEGAPGDAF